MQISIDDYGTSYSSLSYLRELPIDELKLDRSFIFPMADDARAAALVASTIALAHSLGLRMVAEGVETHVDYTELARLGCDQAQDYYMSRPVPAAELDHWLSNRHPGEPSTGIAKAKPSAALGGPRQPRTSQLIAARTRTDLQALTSSPFPRTTSQLRSKWTAEDR